MTSKSASHEPFANPDILPRFHQRRDTVALPTSEAANFLSTSVSSLEAMRAKGTGPTYVQGGRRGAAFWARDIGAMLGMVEQAAVANVIDRLGASDIEWLPVSEAAARAWSDPASHQAFADEVVGVLRREIGRVEGGVEASALAAETSWTSSRRRQGNL